MVAMVMMIAKVTMTCFFIQVAVSRRCNVPLFTPDLRHMSAFAHSTALTSFLHAKIINAERASYYAPKFMRLTVSDSWGGVGVGRRMVGLGKERMFLGGCTTAVDVVVEWTMILIM